MEGTNNILKNRYYLVTKDDKPYAYFSVKKDFYTEGYLVNEKTVLVGYFNGYKSFDVHTIDNLNNSPENHLNGLSIVPKKSTNLFSVDGEILSSDYRLYRANLDEYCNHMLGEEIDCEIQIKRIDDLEIIQDINYLIRSSLRELTGVPKQYYEMLKKHRYGNLKEALSGLKSISEIGMDSLIPDSVISDLELFLKELNPNFSKVNSSCEKNNRKKQKVNKKKIKRKNTKGYK